MPLSYQRTEQHSRCRWSRSRETLAGQPTLTRHHRGYALRAREWGRRSGSGGLPLQCEYKSRRTLSLGWGGACIVGKCGEERLCDWQQASVSRRKKKNPATNSGKKKKRAGTTGARRHLHQHTKANIETRRDIQAERARGSWAVSRPSVRRAGGRWRAGASAARAGPWREPLSTRHRPLPGTRCCHHWCGCHPCRWPHRRRRPARPRAHRPLLRRRTRPPYQRQQRGRSGQ